MTPSTGYTEDALVEQPAIALLARLGGRVSRVPADRVASRGTPEALP